MNGLRVVARLIARSLLGNPRVGQEQPRKFNRDSDEAGRVTNLSEHERESLDKTEEGS